MASNSSGLKVNKKPSMNLKIFHVHTPLLQYPDFNNPFIVPCDVSGYVVGAFLSQKFNVKILPVAYASRTLSDTEINYATIEKELLAIFFVSKPFARICMEENLP